MAYFSYHPYNIDPQSSSICDHSGKQAIQFTDTVNYKRSSIFTIGLQVIEAIESVLNIAPKKVSLVHLWVDMGQYARKCCALFDLNF